MKRSVNKIRNILDIIKKYDNFLIASHVLPEGDAIGSQLALFEFIRSFKKNVHILSQDELSPIYSFLPGAQYIHTKIPKRKKFDISFILDSTDLDRIGSIKSLVENSKLIINIDHHISNSGFGDIVWVDKDAACCGEMIYSLLKISGFRLTKKLALYIYISILVDTGGFRYSNTSSHSHKIVAELIENGVDPKMVYEKIYEEKPITTFKLLSKVLATLEISKDKKVACIKLTPDMLKESKALPFETEDFINYPRSIKGVEVALFFRKHSNTNDEIKISLRSKGKIDVNELAQIFGGGGHRQASGCRIKGDMDKVKRMVLSRIYQNL